MAGKDNLALKILINAEDKASSVFTSLKNNVGKVAAAIAGFFTGKFLASSIEDAKNLETQYLKLDQTIKATGGAAGLTADEIVDMSKRLDEATTGSAEGFRDAANQLLTFKSVGKDAFETTLTLAQDLADAGFGSVTTNAVQLGKALEDPVKGMGALSRSGVTFTDQQKEVVKSLVETGKQAEAQKVILDAVAGQVGGVATAAGKGLAGALDLVSKRFTDVREKIGGAFLPILTTANRAIADFLGKFRDSGAIESFGNLLGTTMSTVMRWLDSARKSASEFVSQVDFDSIKAGLIAFGDAASSVLGTLKETFLSVIGLFKTGATDAETFGQVFNETFGFALDAMTAFASAVNTGLNTIKTAFFALAGVGATFAETILLGVAKIQEGLAKITFGDVSAKWAAAAEESRMVAESFGASAEQNFKKAETALIQTTDSAERTGAALLKLAGDGDTVGVALEDVATRAETAAESVGITADELDALGDNATVLNGKVVPAIKNVGTAAQQTAADVGEMGNQAQQSAEVIEQAFKNLGVTSSAELQRASDKARESFQIIQNSGQATAGELQAAFAAYAQTAIAANEGLIPPALQHEAAQHGVKIAYDETGQAAIIAADAVANLHETGIAGAQAHGASMRDLQGEILQAQSEAMTMNAAIASSQRENKQTRGGFSASFSDEAKKAVAALEASGRDINKIIAEFNKQLFRGVKFGGPSSLGTQSLEQVLIKQASGLPREQAAPRSRETITLDFKLGDRKVSGQFDDSEQTRMLLKQLEAASKTMQ